MGMLVSALRGMHIAVPRDCTHAAGLYNTLLRGDDPGLVIEVLSGYRRKEPMPKNPGTMRIPLGRPEYLRRGSDLTLVTYGACCPVAMDAADNLAEMQVDVEVMDVQTLLPFDVHHEISASLARTNAVLFLDEDVPGGASAYMMQQVLEVQSGWQYLDAAPRTVSAAPTRTGFAVDGDYYGKPSVEDVVRVAYEMVRERNPKGHHAFV
jgi:pyruvate/2-oxoglutarate/acetoin dehydrogenase E1 component